MIDPEINKHLDCCKEKVLFTANYAVNEFGGATTPNSNGEFVPVKVNLPELDNSYSIIGNVFFNGFTKLPGAPEFISEVYNLATYTSNLTEREGLLVWTGTYPNITIGPGITSPSIQSFDVETKSGIYSKVTRVLIDFRKPILRTVYFIGINGFI